uniref:Gamma-interferon-inducible lysosomal thiol reductase n=1 Tax=Dugesia japonica TaxID=6161 RepID=A0A3G3LPG6_DUGJA|nr:gamma-interferon-inducible lysosomal thiol reductase [Dugesia japonica]
MKIILSIILIYHAVSGCYSKISQADKLLLDVYMETRCPDTQVFIDDQLVPVTKLLGNYVEVTLYPYGKAEEKFVGNKWEFICQHGPLECQGNTILACAISMTNQSIYVPFTSCLMRDLNPLSNFRSCCEQFKLDLNLVNKCFQGQKGNELQHHYALATSSLVPKLVYIPWIILNKVYTQANQDQAATNLKALICKHIKVPPPPECS